MNDIHFVSYANDAISYIAWNDIEDVILKLQNASKTIFQWFIESQMKANPDKCHFICSTNITVNLIFENKIVGNDRCEKLLCVKFG